MTDDPGRSPKVRSIRAAIAGHDAEGLPGPGKTLAIDRCGVCPFVGRGSRGNVSFSFCREVGRIEGSGRTHLLPTVAVITGPPPGWCPLRAGPVTLEVES